MKNILVAGGAGYIGSHVVKMLLNEGYNVTVVDNLSTGHRWAVPGELLVVADIGDREKIGAILQERAIDAVMHFAAHIVVPESVRDPYKYYENNFSKTLNLLRAMVDSGTEAFIFSSTAAVYGMPLKVPIPENSPLVPINPYGNTKAAVEKALSDFSGAYPFRYVSLRYFNASGADPEGKIGEDHDPETHLIPLILEAAKGDREDVKIFGTDYPTPDGTCIRDYIHVSDLAKAHILSLAYLSKGGKSDVFNCGYGHGYSVREVVDTCRKVTGIDFKTEEAKRRPGDPPELVADSARIRSTLSWKPEFDDLEYIIETAWNWLIRNSEFRIPNSE